MKTAKSLTRIPSESTPCRCFEMKRIDLAGKRFGALVAERPIPASEMPCHRAGWLVRCDCGREKAVDGSWLRKGLVTSCGCHIERGRRRSAAGNPKAIVDYTGQTFYELTAVERVGRGKWKFRCSCGREVICTPATVKIGKIQSCGHILQEKARERIDKDGENVLGFYDGTMVARLRNIISSPKVYGIRKFTLANGGFRYQARIVLRHKTIHLGSFDDYDSAVKARRDAERIYYLPIIEAWDKEQHE